MYEPEDDEDTIELELTPAEMLGLSQAARQHFPATAQPPGTESLAVGPPVRPSRKARWRVWLVLLALALLGIAAGFAWGPRLPHRQVRPPPPPAVVHSPAPVAVPPPAPVIEQEPQASPVRIQNPFDPQEVFEFPAGIPKAEARQKVSELLLQRAIDRGGPRRYRSSAGKRPIKDD